MITKICTKCGKELPATNEYFTKKKTGIYGLREACKECTHKASKAYQELNKDKIKDKKKKYREVNRELLRKKNRIYSLNNKDKKRRNYEKNKDKYLQRSRERRLSNPEKARDYRKKYYLENKEEILLQCKLYREKNIKKKRLYDKEYVSKNKEKLKAYRANNRTMFAMNQQRRDARKKDLPNNYTVEQWETCKQHFDNECCYCGKELQLTQDHFIPLSKGGEYTQNNIVPCCLSCNCSKHDKDFLKWYKQQSFYSKKREKKIVDYLNYRGGVQQLKIC